MSIDSQELHESEKLIRLPDEAEMQARLTSLSEQFPHHRDGNGVERPTIYDMGLEKRLYPLLCKEAGNEFVASGFALVMLQAVKDYLRSDESMMSSVV